MAVEESLLPLASMAGQAIVAAAATDVWASVKRRFARLLGHGDQRQTDQVERRLEHVREELTGAPADQLVRFQEQLAIAWQTRLLDALEEHPEIAGELRSLIDEVHTQLSASAVDAAGHGLAAGRDVTVTASTGGVAAGTIHGNVMPGNPTSPGLADR